MIPQISVKVWGLAHHRHILCMILPNASRTAWEVKFSEGIRLMKCFWRLFSYEDCRCKQKMGDDSIVIKLVTPFGVYHTELDLLLLNLRWGALSGRISQRILSLMVHQRHTLCCFSLAALDTLRWGTERRSDGGRRISTAPPRRREQQSRNDRVERYAKRGQDISYQSLSQSESILLDSQTTLMIWTYRDI